MYETEYSEVRMYMEAEHSPFRFKQIPFGKNNCFAYGNYGNNMNIYFMVGALKT